MKTKDLKVGNFYTYPFKEGVNFHLYLMEKDEDMLNFATYNSEENAWYIPDTWNYNFENDGFKEFKPPKGLGKQDMIQSLFENVR